MYLKELDTREIPPPIPIEALGRPLRIFEGRAKGYSSTEKINWIMGFAEQSSKRSHDAETKVGAALVNSKSGAIIALGFNGFIRGANDLLLPKTRPDKYPYMVHAEMNLMANCAKHGISMEDCELYCTLSPCITCMRVMWNSGIKRIYVKKLYKDIHQILEMKDLSVEIMKYGGFYVLEYQPYV